MCRALSVSRSGFYAWSIRPESNREQRNKQLLVLIKSSFARSRKTYGYRRIHKDLKMMKVSCGKHRIAKLMQANNIVPKMRKKFRVTTNSTHLRPIQENSLKREFNTDLPNQRWVSDITYIPTNEGWLYLSTVMDLYSRKIVGWAMADNMKESLVIDAVKMAITQRKIKRGLLLHSDRGIQYASDNYQPILEENQIKSSMSRKGDCWDNAVMESFFHTLKTECIYHERLETRNDAKKVIFDYIEVFYNRQRRHSYLDYKSPTEFERTTAVL